MHVRATHLSFYPSWVRSVGLVVSRHVRATDEMPDETLSGWVISFEGGRTKFAKL